jgi:hypothetical protein
MSITRVARFDPTPPEPLQKPSLPMRSLFLSIFLFLNGTVFLLIGLSVFWKASLGESLPFTILGSICFIPGAYHVFVFLKVWLGRDNGYNYDMLENYD